MFFKRHTNTPIVNLSYDEVKELEKLFHETKNPKIQKILQIEIQNIRSKLVTKLINEEYENEIDDENDCSFQPPIKEVFDDVNYWIKELKIKGFKAKLRSIKEQLPDVKRKRISEVLIKMNGKEDEALNYLFTKEVPKKSEKMEVPKEVIEEHERKYENEYEEYEKELKKFKTKRIKFLKDIDFENCVDVNVYNSRISKIKTQIQSLKKLNDMYTNQVQKKSSSSSSISIDEPLFDVETENKIYLPGEKKAILNDEPRLFTFYPERTFANEVNHIHFRVAESQFHRMTANNHFNVKEVKYVVTPYLLRKFEIKKREYAENNPDGENKQYLFFSGHKSNKDTIEWIRMNNYKPSSFKNGRIFSVVSGYCNKFIGDGEKNKQVLLSLVFTGREKIDNINITQNSFQKPSGYHSIMDRSGNHCVVFENECVLPYYIITYEALSTIQANANIPQGNVGQTVPKPRKHLDAFWTDMKKDAEADKKMDDIKKFYSKELGRKEKEAKMGKINPTNDWFTKYLEKKLEKEEEKGGKESMNIVEYEEEEEEDLEFESPDVVDESGTESDVFLDTPTPTPIDEIDNNEIFKDDP